MVAHLSSHLGLRSHDARLLDLGRQDVHLVVVLLVVLLHDLHLRVGLVDALDFGLVLEGHLALAAFLQDRRHVLEPARVLLMLGLALRARDAHVGVHLLIKAGGALSHVALDRLCPLVAHLDRRLLHVHLGLGSCHARVENLVLQLLLCGVLLLGLLVYLALKIDRP